MAQQMRICVDRASHDVINASIINIASVILNVIRELRISSSCLDGEFEFTGELADQVHQNPSQLKMDRVIEGGTKGKKISPWHEMSHKSHN